MAERVQQEEESEEKRRSMIAHCLFEQSGTFKNEFKKLGIEAYDYDIRNDYGQTDFQVDLFEQIRGGTMESHLSSIG